ncbi:CxxH/CxxC protein [Exiguobacterium sp.]|uniref:CxxH/CxxC protein n=1 Tax=Exiguobacterium sp. TaxID=44751 RepID=UPI00391AB229
MKKRRRFFFKEEKPVEKKVCKEHVEIALDIIVDETGEYPLLEELSTSGQVKCEFCEADATYVVSSKK